MGVELCLLDSYYCFPSCSLLCDDIEKNGKDFISRRIGLSYQNNSRLFEKV
jgi:hypothetical protein